MKMEVEIISKECIKPSSPTPPSLKTYKLSLLDQVIPSAYIPVIFFYPMNKSISHYSVVDIVSQRSHMLKQSLSDTLTHFYPFAGKIKDNHLSIDRNDNGVLYLEAYANCHLVDYLKQPNLGSLEKLVPQGITSKELIPGDYLAMIKVTSFACGAIAIGLLVSHVITDGISLSVFLKGWAATAGKACETVCPNFDAPSIFIQNEALSRETITTALSKSYKSGRCIVWRFVFDASDIASLKAKATSSSVQNPTRVEVVSALIWKCTMTAFKATSGIQRPTFITHAVNFRPRAYPPFTESSMGNLLWGTDALYTAKEIDLAEMMSKLRKAITKINDDFVKSLQGDGGFFKFCELMKGTTACVGLLSNKECSCGMDHIAVTNWSNFGLCDIDFGWGKPMWVSGIGSNGDLKTALVPKYDNANGYKIRPWNRSMGLVRKRRHDCVSTRQGTSFFRFLDPSPI